MTVSFARVLILSAFLSAGFCLNAQSRKLSVSAGYGMLLYQSTYSIENSAGVELTVGKCMGDPRFVQLGGRVSLDKFHPELFVRGGFRHTYKAWRPFVALEAGVTDRAHFGPGDKLLQESREAMRDDIGRAYVAFQISPLAFSTGERWVLSFCEIQIGTHLSHIGRTMRIHGSLVTISTSFGKPFQS